MCGIRRNLKVLLIIREFSFLGGKCCVNVKKCFKKNKSKFSKINSYRANSGVKFGVI